MYPAHPVIWLFYVLHELSDIENIIEQIKRVLKQEGLLAIIEFHKKKTPMGPPIDKRLDSQDVADMMEKFSLSCKHCFSLGENFYVMVFSRK